MGVHAVDVRVLLREEDALRQVCGIGKPEALRHDMAGFWSRRITDEHRLVYAVEKNQLLVAQARYHY